MLCEPQETPYDVRFRLFGFPVRVHPMFWVCMVLLGPTDIGGRFGAAPLVIWVGCAFVSILIHELGHAFMFRYYRCRSHIALHWLGGLAVPDGRPPGHWPNIWISLAGPAADLLVCAAVWATDYQFGWSERHDYLAFAYIYLYAINLYWALINLLPVWPLDGGQVCREVCYLLRARRPEEVSLKISIGAAVGFAVYSLLHYTGQADQLFGWLPWRFPAGGMWSMLFFLALAYGSYEALQSVRRYSYGGYADDYGDRHPWER